MKGFRKLVLGIAYLASVTFVAITALSQPVTDYVGVASIIGAIGGGLFGVIYGNVKEHQAENGNKENQSRAHLS